MLQVADRYADEGFGEVQNPSPSRLSLVRPEVAPVVAVSGPRYGERRAPNIPAILLIILFHAILIYALMQARQHVRHMQETQLSVVNLTPPPPPPAAEAPPPPPAEPLTVAPPPLVQVPVPPLPQIATTPEPVNVPTPVLAARLTGASASPAPAAAPSIVQGGDLGAQMLAGKPPRYPVESRRRHEQGTVILALTLATDGGVESIEIAQSSGFARLDNAARDAVRGWRWKPLMRGGLQLRVKGIVEIPFVLRAEKA